MTQMLDFVNFNRNDFKDGIISRTIINETPGGRFKSGGGSCILDSMRTWIKMRKAGAIRVKGKRDIERANTGRTGKDHYHYWVENKGKVFDITLNKLSIFSKTDFYNNLNISDTIIAPYSGLFLEEVEWVSDYDVEEIERNKKGFTSDTESVEPVFYNFLLENMMIALNK